MRYAILERSEGKEEGCSSMYSTPRPESEQALPLQFCQLREQIKFKLDDNKLVWLPFHIGHISKLRLLSAAHKTYPNPLGHTIQLTFPLALQEMASRAVANISVNYIKTAVSMNLHLVSHTVVLVDDMGGTDVPVHHHFCSLSCYSEFLD
ncbi:leucine-rich repeat protein 1-like [Oncorhynchus nerka]|uniref:leucine-rich repeat protein 1-like n=1 Tax=Oncorhynchus nerka TaxID=8023 RepID=UPI0011325282|nr:leucine-rich repeat protein 1-like [Oncorhynchus nerka]